MLGMNNIKPKQFSKVLNCLSLVTNSSGKFNRINIF